MEFGETGFADHEQSSPHQRTHAAEKDTKLIDRNGRYGRFSHAGILPKPTGTVLSLTPEISRSRSDRFIASIVSVQLVDVLRDEISFDAVPRQKGQRFLENIQ